MPERPITVALKARAIPVQQQPFHAQALDRINQPDIQTSSGPLAQTWRRLTDGASAGNGTTVQVPPAKRDTTEPPTAHTIPPARTRKS